MVQTWLHTQSKIFFADGLRKLMDQCNKCVEKIEIMSKNDSTFVLVYLL